MKQPRIIQIVGTGNHWYHGVFALCEDGSLWHFRWGDGWRKVPALGGNYPLPIDGCRAEESP